jgi:hypothetical protein
VSRDATSAKLYAASARRVLKARGLSGLSERLRRREERIVFVLGSPRSGTTFLAGVIGVPGWRGVEQTPETAFVLGAALCAYPQAKAVHVVRDGRDVVCSLLERGWLSAGRGGGDDARLAYGSRARFWVEPARLAEFEGVCDATRAAWAWRSYVTAARAVADERVLEVRYESIAADPAGAAAAIARHLGVSPAPLQRSLERFHDRSIGRYRRDLGPEQLADVEREAGSLLHELGYD